MEQSMSLLLEKFKEVYFEMLEETFEKVHGYYLDRGTSLFETLETISAEVASRPVSANCASIAAHVEHVNFYLNYLEGHMLNQNPPKANWKETWERVQAVSPDEWEASKQKLKASYQHIRETMQSFDSWEGEEDISGAMSILIHTAHHLGEIRQACCTVKP
jgi:hypothetical protein